MKPMPRPEVARTRNVDQVTLDLFTSEGAPAADPLPECISAPAELEMLEPRRMPSLAIACPEPRGAAPQRYRMPLWRGFEPLEGD